MQNDTDIDNNNAPNVGVDDVVAGASTNEILDEGNTTTGGTGNYNGEVVDDQSKIWQMAFYLVANQPR